MTEWLELEKAWSPYHLTDDLVIPQFQTMTINDGVYLRVADQEATITVEGTFNSGYSTISSMGGGIGWGGLVIGGRCRYTGQDYRYEFSRRLTTGYNRWRIRCCNQSRIFGKVKRSRTSIAHDKQCKYGLLDRCFNNIR